MTTDLVLITNSDFDVWRRVLPQAFGKPFGERLGVAAAWCAFAAVIIFCLWHMDFTPQRVWRGIWKLGWLVQLMFPPWHGGWLGEFSYAMLQTLAMAFLGTLL